MDGNWTITELAAAATAALDGEPAQVNGRVRDMPNERLIRWYTTIGLVDPPAGRRGRTALYGPRHLLQLVAIKRRQAAGRTIADIQTELAGATDAMLREIGRLPAVAAPAPAQQSATEASTRFWAARPVPHEPAVYAGEGAQADLVRGVRLAPGVTLLLDADELTGADLIAIGNAARPLLAELQRRGLAPAPVGDPTPSTDDPA